MKKYFLFSLKTIPLKILILVLVLLFFVNQTLAQSATEFLIGNGFYAKFTPPPGWISGVGFGDEKCWYAPEYVLKVCIKNKYRNEKSAEEILSNITSGLNYFNEKIHLREEENLRTVLKEAEMRVGPKIEGVVWSVTDFKYGNYVLVITISVTSDGENSLNILSKSINNIEFYYKE